MSASLQNCEFQNHLSLNQLSFINSQYVTVALIIVTQKCGENENEIK